MMTVAPSARAWAATLCERLAASAGSSEAKGSSRMRSEGRTAQRAGDGHAPGHAEGELFGGVAGDGGEADAGEEGLDFGVCQGGFGEAEVGGDIHPGEARARILEHRADAALGPLDGAGKGCVQAQDDAQGGGFACAGRRQESEHFAGGGFETDGFEHRFCAEALGLDGDVEGGHRQALARRSAGWRNSVSKPSMTRAKTRP